MLLRFSILLLIACSFGAASAADTAGTSTLKVDLGAVVRTESVHPVDGITSSGQPDEAALKVFAAQGYTTVIDLRTEGEDRGLDEPAVVRQLGMAYVPLPIGRDSVNFDSAKALNNLIENAQGPVLVHCGSGNRVGALLALRKSLAGADEATALKYGREGGMTGLESQVKEILDTE
jgi:uncharacterized protein (TIGR01244 family)